MLLAGATIPTVSPGRNAVGLTRGTDEKDIRFEPVPEYMTSGHEGIVKQDAAAGPLKAAKQKTGIVSQRLKA
jgi:hypothetical protein